MPNKLRDTLHTLLGLAAVMAVGITLATIYGAFRDGVNPWQVLAGWLRPVVFVSGILLSLWLGRLMLRA